ncbi:unnamed protein product, partial [Penicillium discolor]
EQRLPDVAALRAPRGHREHGGSDRDRPLVEQVELVEPLLHRDELPRDVGLERGEEQPGFGDAVSGRALVVVVRPAEDALRPIPACAPDVRERRDDGEPDGRRRVEVRLVELRRPRERRPVTERPPHRGLAASAIQAVPGVEVHADAAQDHARAAGEPAVIAPHHPVEVLGPRLRVARAVDLTEEVPHGRPRSLGAVRAAEALLDPPDGREAARVLQEHTLRVRDGQGVVGGELQEQVSVRELRLQAVHPEGGQRSEPGRTAAAGPRHESRAEPERDRQPGRGECELRLRVCERRSSLGEPRRVVRENTQEPAESVAVDLRPEVERHERAVRLGRGVDPCLMDTVERDGEGAVERCGGRGSLRVRSREGEVGPDRDGGADTGDSPSEEELPPGRAGAAVLVRAGVVLHRRVELERGVVRQGDGESDLVTGFQRLGEIHHHDVIPSGLEGEAAAGGDDETPGDLPHDHLPGLVLHGLVQLDHRRGSGGDRCHRHVLLALVDEHAESRGHAVVGRLDPGVVDPEIVTGEGASRGLGCGRSAPGVLCRVVAGFRRHGGRATAAEDEEGGEGGDGECRARPTDEQDPDRAARLVCVLIRCGRRSARGGRGRLRAPRRLQRDGVSDGEGDDPRDRVPVLGDDLPAHLVPAVRHVGQEGGGDVPSAHLHLARRPVLALRVDHEDDGPGGRLVEHEELARERHGDADGRGVEPGDGARTHRTAGGRGRGSERGERGRGAPEKRSEEAQTTARRHEEEPGEAERRSGGARGERRVGTPAHPADHSDGERAQGEEQPLPAVERRHGEEGSEGVPEPHRGVGGRDDGRALGRGEHERSAVHMADSHAGRADRAEHEEHVEQELAHGHREGEPGEGERPPGEEHAHHEGEQPGHEDAQRARHLSAAAHVTGESHEDRERRGREAPHEGGLAGRAHGHQSAMRRRSPQA